MRGRFGYLIMTVAAAGLMALAACNSGGSSGGATEDTTAGYSAANLAGTWTGSMSCQPNPCYFTISFDATGKVLSFKFDSPAQGYYMTGTVKVDAAGRLSGQTIFVDNGVQSEKYDWRKLKFVATDKVSGAWLVLEIQSPNPTWDTFTMSMTKQ